RSESTAGLNVLNVEFGWDQQIRTARQIVQERLATVTGQLPRGVTPYMAPSSSILGQIVIAGLSRRPGPRGGRLAPVGTTALMAERGEGQQVTVWNPVGRDVEAWKPAQPDSVEWEGEVAAITVAGRRHAVAFPTDEQQQQALRTTADWVVRPLLRRI